MTEKLTLGQIVFDCPDPLALATFYADLLDCKVVRDGEEWVDLEGIPVGFQRIDDYVPPSWPDGEPQQAHLDLTVEEMAAAHERVIALGATPLEPTSPPAPGDPHTFRVYADPAGHPFCLCMC